MYFTANRDKEHDFVNGMPAIVDANDPESGLEVVTVTGQRHGVHRITEDVDGHGQVSYYPVRVGYVCTVPMVLSLSFTKLQLLAELFRVSTIHCGGQFGNGASQPSPSCAA